MIIKQSCEVYYKQWRDYFDYIRVSLILPEIVAGTYGISDRIRNSSFAEENLKSFYINFNTSIGVNGDAHSREYSFIVFGFGVSILRQWSY